MTVLLIQLLGAQMALQILEAEGDIGAWTGIHDKREASYKVPLQTHRRSVASRLNSPTGCLEWRSPSDKILISRLLIQIDLILHGLIETMKVCQQIRKIQFYEILLIIQASL